MAIQSVAVAYFRPAASVAPGREDYGSGADRGTEASGFGREGSRDTITLSREGLRRAEQQAAAENGTSNAVELTEEEQEQVRKLKARDREVRAHEQAHRAAGGQYAGAADYQYTQGPDGRRYATGGEVSIDLSPIPGDPAATAQKMRQVRRAALAPAEPSPQDRRVAAQASRLAAQAGAEARRENAGEIIGANGPASGEKAGENPQAALAIGSSLSIRA